MALTFSKEDTTEIDLTKDSIEIWQINRSVKRHNFCGIPLLNAPAHLKASLVCAPV